MNRREMMKMSGAAAVAAALPPIPVTTIESAVVIAAPSNGLSSAFMERIGKNFLVAFEENRQKSDQ